MFKHRPAPKAFSVVTVAVRRIAILAFFIFAILKISTIILYFFPNVVYFLLTVLESEDNIVCWK